MTSNTILSILSDWSDEFNASLSESNTLCAALFSTNRELLYINKSMSVLLKGETADSFINPTFEQLLLCDNSVSKIFQGFLTLGDYSSVNVSIWAQVYRKENKLLVLGGADTLQLLEQNKTMHQLNREISNLQRELIKEKKALESTLQQLNHANKELTELNTSKDRFISILAHDLKSPFGPILGFLDLLTENIRTYSIEKIEVQVNLINKAAQNTYNLLNDILLWVRAESGKLPFEPQNYSLADICNGVINSLEQVAFKKSIAINYHADHDIYIYADLNMIKTVLRNLISNAIKFTNNGGWINITAIQKEMDVAIAVSDNGIGIVPETLSKLFNISHKITTKGTANEKGTGLGLLLCKELTELNSGKIEAESMVGIGTTFTVHIPASDVNISESNSDKVTATFFESQDEFRKWLVSNHEKETELIVGFYKVDSGKPSMNWSQSVDQALCFGWIDGVRKSIDKESYSIRFTPRRSTSNWSAININKIEELTKAGLMKPAGLKAFGLRKDNKSAIYSYENGTEILDSKYEKQFKKNKIAWDFFMRQAPSYKKTIMRWIMSAKQEKTRQSRLEKTIKESGQQKRVL